MNLTIKKTNKLISFQFSYYLPQRKTLFPKLYFIPLQFLLKKTSFYLYLKMLKIFLNMIFFFKFIHHKPLYIKVFFPFFNKYKYFQKKVWNILS